MCIVIVKEKGVELPSKGILEHCWKKNPHGGGFMYLDKGSVVINKGHMDFNSFWKELKKRKFKKDDTVVLHFRIATAGGIRPSNCHPFPVVGNEDKLRALKCKTKMGMVHNGVLGPGEDDLSDTMLFVLDILSDPMIKNNLDNPAIAELIETYVEGSRVVVLEASGKFHFFGDWIRDDETGLLYSNNGFRGVLRNYPNAMIRTTIPAGPIKTTFKFTHKKEEKKGKILVQAKASGCVQCNSCSVVLKGYKIIGEPHWRNNAGELSAIETKNGYKCRRCIRKEDK